MEKPNKKNLVICVGKEFMGDDSAGVFVARSLKDTETDLFIVKEQSGEGAKLIEAWQGAKTVVIVDVVSSGAPPGTIHRCHAHKGTVPSMFSSRSSFVFGVTEAIETSRSQNILPPHLVIYGIEGKIFKKGTDLSPEVKKASEQMVDSIMGLFSLLF